MGWKEQVASLKPGFGRGPGSIAFLLGEGVRCGEYWDD